MNKETLLSVARQAVKAVPEVVQYLSADTLAALKGGEGSGNFGHEGRPGEVGGSAPSGGGSGETPKFTVSRSETWDDGITRNFGSSPFPKYDRKIELATGNEIKLAREETIDLNSLYATQSEVVDIGLAMGIREDDLPLVIHSNGISYIQDGHHRLSAALYAGRTQAKVRYLDLDKLHNKSTPTKAELLGYPPIRANYWAEIYDSVEQYLTGNKPVTSFRNKASIAVSEAFTDAVYEGYAQAGAELPLPDDVAAWLSQRIAEERTHIEGMFDRLKQEWEGLDWIKEAYARADGYARTLDSMYSEAQLRGMKNQMVTWVLGDTEEHCTTCATLAGKKHRISYLIANNYIPRKPDAGMDCHGYRCDCKIVDKNGKEVTIGETKAMKGGEGSGNFGHAGRPGEVGGSAANGGVGDIIISGDINMDTSKETARVVKELSKKYDFIQVGSIGVHDSLDDGLMNWNADNKKLSISKFMAQFDQDILNQYAQQAGRGNGQLAQTWRDMVIHEMGHSANYTIRDALLSKGLDDINKDFFDDIDELVRTEPAPSLYGERSRQEWIAERFLLETQGNADNKLIGIFEKYHNLSK